MIGKILCKLNFHDWKEDRYFDDDWGGVTRSFYCTRCSLIRQDTYSNTYYMNRYYREWFSYKYPTLDIQYDSVLSVSKELIRMDKPKNALLKWFMADDNELGYYNSIVKITNPKHLKLSSKELKEIYGGGNWLNENK
jgi:hypothetical protein